VPNVGSLAFRSGFSSPTPPYSFSSTKSAFYLYALFLIFIGLGGLLLFNNETLFAELPVF